jgi:hypothetical protein
MGKLIGHIKQRIVRIKEFQYQKGPEGRYIKGQEDLRKRSRLLNSGRERLKRIRDAE